MTADRASDGSWSVERGAAGSLISRFFGPTPTASFGALLSHLSERMPPSDATLVFDLRDVEGYNPDLKEPVKDWLLQHKLVIRELVVVVPKWATILKVSTAAVGLAAGIKITLHECARGSALPSSLAEL